jgi:hypothetical protein
MERRGWVGEWSDKASTTLATNLVGTSLTRGGDDDGGGAKLVFKPTIERDGGGAQIVVPLVEHSVSSNEIM